MADLRCISSFLSTVEGRRQTRGYIPCNKKSGGTANYTGGPNPENYIAMGASGVTIATGCDLGQTTASTLAAYGLPQSVISAFLPYIGKKKADAINVLHKQPLVISPQAAEQTDMAVHKGYLDRYVRPAWEKAAKASFDGLPAQAQAVIMSVCFQKGCGGVRKDWPKLWGCLVNQDWHGAAGELLTGFTQYKNRRQTEGRLLLELAA